MQLSKAAIIKATTQVAGENIDPIMEKALGGDDRPHPHHSLRDRGMSR